MIKLQILKYKSHYLVHDKKNQNKFNLQVMSYFKCGVSPQTPLTFLS